MRQLPIYILINTTTDNLYIQKQIEDSLHLLISTLQQLPYALEQAFIRVLSYNDSLHIITPKKRLEGFNVPKIKFNIGHPDLNRALIYLSDIINSEVAKSTSEKKGDFSPIVYLITDTDTLIDINTVSHLAMDKGSRIIVCTSINSLEDNIYTDISNSIVSFEGFNKDFIFSSVKWVSSSIDAVSCDTVLNIPLPPPPSTDLMIVDTCDIPRNITYSPTCSPETSNKNLQLRNLERQKEAINKKILNEKSRLYELNKKFSSPPTKSSTGAGILYCLTSIIGGIGIGAAARSLGKNNESEVHKRHASEICECEKKIQFYKNEVSFLENEIKNLKKSLEDNGRVYSSIFSNSEVKRKSNLLTQIFLHLANDTEQINALAKETDKNAERKDYIPLSLKLKNGDRVDVDFKIYGVTELMSDRKSIIWNGEFAKCSFRFFIPEDINVDELYCVANITINGALIGEMNYITHIVESPHHLNPEILVKRYNKIFISYAHQDSDQANMLALAYKAQGAEYFYDRHCLAPGDIYEEKIFNFIDSSDLFVLCWSENAAKSEYVAKEKARALQRAYPQLSHKEAKLRICPISIKPRAKLPEDMINIYNFEVI